MTPCTDHGYKGDRDGYSQKDLGRGKRKPLRHRIAYAEANGLDEATMGGVVMHSCDNPRCINPKHLSRGTVAQNVADRQAKQRQQRGETHYRAKFSDELVERLRAEYLPPIKGVRVSNQKELSLKYGVSIPQVSHIVNHKGRNLPAREV